MTDNHIETSGISFLQTTKIIVLTGSVVMVMPFLHTGRKRAPLLSETEEPMTTIDFITALFYEVDEQMRPLPKHPEAYLWPSEVVTLGLLHALKGVGNRPFYRWLTRDYRPLVSPPPRAHPALSPLPDPSRLDTGLPRRPDDPWGH